MFPKCHIFFLFSQLEYVRLTTRDSRQVHIFILSLNNYCWRTLVFLMDPGLKIRMMWCLSFSCSSFVLHQWDFFDPRIRCSCSLHSLLLNMNITLHPLSLTVSPCLSSHSELPSLSPPLPHLPEGTGSCLSVDNIYMSRIWAIVFSLRAVVLSLVMKRGLYSSEILAFELCK